MLAVACNAVGEQGGTALGGHSRVVDPWGNVLVEAGDDEGVTMIDVDPDTVRRVRAEFPVLEDRRPPLTLVPASGAVHRPTRAARPTREARTAGPAVARS